MRSMTSNSRTHLGGGGGGGGGAWYGPAPCALSLLEALLPGAPAPVSALPLGAPSAAPVGGRLASRPLRAEKRLAILRWPRVPLPPSSVAESSRFLSPSCMTASSSVPPGRDATKYWTKTFLCCPMR